MVWPTPQYSRNQVNNAGQFLKGRKGLGIKNLDVKALFRAFRIVDNWRSCHGYPINTFQATLRNKLKTIDSGALVAQRLKRMPSIINKLHRINSMQLARMQDLGGLRAVVSNLRRVRLLEKNYRDTRFDHELVTSKDYIAEPKSSGYRSIHLIYKYKNRSKREYNGLLVELQIRTRLQHTWATAVETMGTFLEHSLKSSEGPEPWLDFFTLSGAAFAHLEGTPPVPGYETMNKEDTFIALLNEAKELNVRNNLQTFTGAVETIHADKGRKSYYLVVLNPEKKAVTINAYSRGSLGAASKEYKKVELRIEQGEQLQAVLVSAGSIQNLRRAYPNYFLDTREFIKQLDRIEKRLKK